MKKLVYMAMAMASVLMTACSTGTEQKSDTVAVVTEEEVDTIPYRIALGYELLPGVKELHTAKFGSSKAFNQYFRAVGGNKTEIDFNKEYVIAAIKPDAKDSRLIFDGINEASGERLLMTFYTEPATDGKSSTSLLIVVPDSVEGYVDVKEII